MNRKAQRSRVPRAASRRRCRLSREATGLYTARTASDPERETAGAGEGVAIAVSWGGISTVTNKVLPMTSKKQFSPLCDLHHVPMRRVMLEEDSGEIRSYHACERRGCTRVFRDSNGYSDWIEGKFDESRTPTRACPQCGANLYLAEVDRSKKVEIWECPQSECNFSEEYPSPSAR